ncbi:MAG TPA: ComEA family DNA-binding protein [Dehalococcoidales bacterium]|nr:ComEA family DNA-binding protein [Dehalococcoidales bacterium]
MCADSTSKAKQFFTGWGFVTVLLTLIIIGAAVYTGITHGNSKGLEITVAADNQTAGKINISGDVANPGIYPLKPGDTISDILKAAGGASANADYLALSVGKADSNAPQKVDINRAGTWLLAALPGIGGTRAQAIVQYREKNGPFRDIYELQKVPGIGGATFNGIKDLITVGE